jgi:hypothetical protein
MASKEVFWGTPPQRGRVTTLMARKTRYNKETKMPLSVIQGGGGQPYVRFSIEENEWMQSSENGLEAFDVKSAPILIDVNKVEMGWLKLAGGRDWQPWPDNNPQKLERPSDQHTQGFNVKLYSTKLFGDEPVRELCSSQIGLIDWIKQLYDACEAAPEFATKVPAIKFGDAPKRKVGKGSTRTPEFEIVGWKDRPSEMAGQSEPVRSDPPAAASSPAAASDDEDFVI